jgi:hypothetical protein
MWDLCWKRLLCQPSRCRRLGGGVSVSESALLVSKAARPTQASVFKLRKAASSLAYGVDDTMCIRGIQGRNSHNHSIAVVVSFSRNMEGRPYQPPWILLLATLVWVNQEAKMHSYARGLE